MSQTSQSDIGMVGPLLGGAMSTLDHEAKQRAVKVYAQRAFRTRLREAFESGIILAVKYGIASLLVLGLWGASGYVAWNKLQTSVVQALHGQQAFQWLSEGNRYATLEEIVKERQAAKAPAPEPSPKAGRIGR